MIAVAALLLVRITVVLLLAALLGHSVARRSAALRHAIWTSALFGSAALVVAPWVLPQFAVLPAVVVPGSMSVTPFTTVVAGSVWALGTTMLLARLLIGLYSLHQLTRRANGEPPNRDTRTHHMFAPADAEASVVVFAGVRSPSCWGIRRPAILLPLDAITWSAEHTHHVLSHEFAHLQRRDPLWRLLRQVSCALCWFHPMVWRVARLADDAAEEATDNAVLSAGTSATAYARSLVTSAVAPRHALLLSFAREHPLSRRIRAILDAQAERTGPRRAHVVASVGALFACTVTLGSLAPDTPNGARRAAPVVATSIAPVPHPNVVASAKPTYRPRTVRRPSAERTPVRAMRTPIITVSHTRDVLDQLDDPTLQFDQRRRAAILAEALQSTTFSRAQVERFLAALCGLPSGRVRARLLAQVLQRPKSDALVRGALPIIHGLPSSRDRGLLLVQASARGDLSTEETMLDDLAANAVRRGEGVRSTHWEGTGAGDIGLRF